MNAASKVLIVVALLTLVGVVMAVKYRNNSPDKEPTPAAEAPGDPKESSPPVTINVTGENANVQIGVDAGTAEAAANQPAGDSQEAVEQASGLPRLVDLGADKCIPCKMMAPILEELESDYAGRLQVDFFDVWKDPAAAEHYGVKMIPTQIFFDPDGKELFRHVGFFSKPDILKKWNELGFDFEKGGK